MTLFRGGGAYVCYLYTDSDHRLGLELDLTASGTRAVSGSGQCNLICLYGIPNTIICAKARLSFIRQIPAVANSTRFRISVFTNLGNES
jgi:hypothetical protein